MAGISKEAQLSIAASSMFPGFRFSPTDEELISYYLKNKCDDPNKGVEVISEVDICNFEPWDLPGLFDTGWSFFFSFAINFLICLGTGFCLCYRIVMEFVGASC